MFAHQYPLFLAKEHHLYTVLNKRTTAIYWGALFSFGDEGTVLFGDVREDVYAPAGIEGHPRQYTKTTGMHTELVLGWSAFEGQDFALDLSLGTLEISSMIPRIGKKILLQTALLKHAEMPAVEVTINGVKYPFQIDVGDRYSSVPSSIVKDMKPVRTETIEPYGAVEGGEKVDIYRVPLQLSEDVIIESEAIVISEDDMAAFSYVSTNGCIGVDLIRNHRVTFTSGNGETGEAAMYLKSFKGM